MGIWYEYNFGLKSIIIFVFVIFLIGHVLDEMKDSITWLPEIVKMERFVSF